MSQFTKLKQSRARVKGFVTRTANSISEHTTPIEATVKLEKIEGIWKEFDDIQQAIEDHIPEDETEADVFLAECEGERAVFETQYFNTVSQLHAIVETSQQQISPNTQNLQVQELPQTTHSNVSKLPEIKLPEFDGDYKKWRFFKNSFESTIHNNSNLSNVQRHQYLVGVLKGEAQSVIEGFTIGEETYTNAWDLLNATYDNQMMIIQTHLDELFKFPEIEKENKADSMRKLNWHIQTNISALKSLNQPVDHWDTLIIHLVKQKLDYLEQRDWQERIKNRTPENMPTLQEFTKFLAERCQSLMLLKQTLKSKTLNKQSPGNKYTQKENKQDKKVLMINTPSFKCNICEGNHFIFQCETLLKQTPDERRQLLIKKKHCLNCLKFGHLARDCRGTRCKKCNSLHNTLLHKDSASSESQEKATTSEANRLIQLQESTLGQGPSVNLTRVRTSQVLLSTALVNVVDNKGKRITCRALLDPGAQLNLVTTTFSKRLNLQWFRQNQQFSGVSGAQVEAKGINRIQLYSMDSQYSIDLECYVVPSITGRLPQYKVNINEIVMPKNIQLADPSFNEPGDVDLLLGASIYWKIVVGRPKNNIAGQPALQDTKLGWILGGEIQENKAEGMSTCLTMTNDTLSQQLERFWLQEKIPETQHYTKEEQFCEELFAETTTRDSSGRFVVRLPIRPGVTLGESKEQAKRRLAALERKFNKQQNLKQAYCDFMDEYEALGHMSHIEETAEDESDKCYFIPHHAVLRPESSSTKLRVVFDASAKTTRGTSLNDKLFQGPNLQADLFHIILRFRMHQYVITADIEKMFRQIMIHHEDRPLQQILWRRDTLLPIKTYQLNTVTYGTASAPYHAMRCLRELANIYDPQYPVAAKIMRQDFYMDDCITGGDTVDAVIQIHRQLMDLLQKGQMLLRKWRSNHKEIIKHLNIQSNARDLMVLDKEEASKTLGIVWDSTKDTLQYQVNLSSEVVYTKREILSKISQVFDPLGLVSPVLIRGKIIMQQLWTDGFDWDQPVTTDKLSIWNQYYSSLPQLNQLRIIRNVNPENYNSKFDLFGFSDASEKAYGACIYAVNRNQDGMFTSHLISAKSKVAPLKTISMPRLELEAALLLTSLVRETKAAAADKIRNVYLWSDSTIVLGWINTESRLLKTFVANRVTKIQDAAENAKWGHVPSQENPADLISRGIPTIDIINHHLWWFGPNWLVKENSLPPSTLQPDISLPEMKSSKVMLTIASTSKILHKFSSFSKLRRVIAYCHRFVNNTLNKVQRKKWGKGSKDLNTNHITPEEIKRAETTVLKWLQIEAFSSSHKCLSKKETPPRGSPLRCLDPFIDEDGLMRVGGRLRHSALSEEQKHPILLPANHHITTAIMRYEHHHCPPEQLLHSTRQKYWPISGRREAQKIVRKCVQCFRFNPIVPEVRMGDLPKERVSKVTRPFTVTGVDYAGPFQLRESRRRGRLRIFKAYIAVFTCFSTKAVHLELVSELTTEAYLAAMQRFTARRGICHQMFSDNGRTFVGAANALKELQSFLAKESPIISSHLGEKQIAWQFIPPRSPHFGGLWEAAVKIAKRHLYTSSQGRVHTFEEMYTLLCDIEAVLNSRPLTPLTRDPNDLDILTPAHFLIGDSLVQPVQSNHTQEPDNRLSRWQHLKKLRQVLWQRWQREYLQELQKRNKWFTSNQRIELNTLVLLIEEGIPPLRWPRGRVIHVHPGPDGEIRVVTVKTAEGNFTRSVKKLCPLPMENFNEEFSA